VAGGRYHRDWSVPRGNAFYRTQSRPRPIVRFCARGFDPQSR